MGSRDLRENRGNGEISWKLTEWFRAEVILAMVVVTRHAADRDS